jgi:hypothetical protein
MRLDRRWWVAIAIAVVAVAAVAASYFYFGGPSSQQCRPVKDLLDFNRSQAQKIASKDGDEQGLPTVADDAAYQAWADGLAERAQKVTSADLAQTASAVAKLADEFVGQLPVLRAQTASRAPGAPAPPAAYDMSLLNAEITDNLAKLSKACS